MIADYIVQLKNTSNIYRSRLNFKATLMAFLSRLALFLADCSFNIYVIAQFWKICGFVAINNS